MDHKNSLLEQKIKVEKKLFETYLDYWKEEVVFNFQWWFGIVFMIAAIYCFYKFIDRKQLLPTSIATMVCLILSINLDVIGIGMGLWAYPNITFPYYGPLFSVDMLFITLPCALLYQKAKTWKHFIVGTLIMTSVFSFVFEPFAVWIKLYVLMGWEYYYSLPIYSAVFFLSKWIGDKARKMQGEPI